MIPAFSDLKIYILDEYYQHLRPEPGLGSLPNGREMYKVAGYLKDDSHGLRLKPVASAEICVSAEIFK